MIPNDMLLMEWNAKASIPVHVFWLASFSFLVYLLISISICSFFFLSSESLVVNPILCPPLSGSLHCEAIDVFRFE